MSNKILQRYQNFQVHNTLPPAKRTPQFVCSPLVVVLLLLVCCIVVLLLTSLVDLDNNGDELGVKRFRGAGNNNNNLDDNCKVAIENEKLQQAKLSEQLRSTEKDLSDLRTRHRELEADFRDLALNSRAQAATKLPDNNDVSILQRLSKCRSSLEESVGSGKELRDQNKNLDQQVGRLQKELREAISDADEQERLLKTCNEKLKKGIPPIK